MENNFISLYQQTCFYVDLSAKQYGVCINVKDIDRKHEYTEMFRKYIGKDRKRYTKKIFKIMGTIYRGVTKERFTWEEVEEKLFEKM